MKLKLDVTPDLAALMAAEIKAGEKAVTVAMREAGGQLKTDWRRQITGAGLGQRLARSIRAETWPKGTTSIGAASLVWSKAPAIVGAHDTGPLIRSKTGFWLAIPTPAAGRGLRGDRSPPANGSDDGACACASSIAAAAPACWSPTAPGSTSAARRWPRARRLAAIRSPRLSSCWSRRSSCPSGWIWIGMQRGRTTACRG